MSMSPAAVTAILKGDLANAMAALTSGGIERQEAQGQQDFVNSMHLPRECLDCTREDLEEMGVVFGDIIDDLFINVQLPKGWKKMPTEHSMWSLLLDEKERERGSIFYKAAFYDQKAHISLSGRFNCRVEPINGYENSKDQQGEWVCIVRDGEREIWRSEEIDVEPEYNHNDEEQREIWVRWDRDRDALRKKGMVWLNAHFPDWQNKLSYWSLSDAEIDAVAKGFFNGN